MDPPAPAPNQAVSSLSILETHDDSDDLPVVPAPVPSTSILQAQEVQSSATLPSNSAANPPLESTTKSSQIIPDTSRRDTNKRNRASTTLSSSSSSSSSVETLTLEQQRGLKRKFGESDQDHDHNTLEPLIKNFTLGQTARPILPLRSERRSQDIEKEAARAALEKGPVEPQCSKKTTSKYSQGHIEAANKSSDEDEETESEYRPLPRVKRGKRPDNSTRRHPLPTSAPAPRRRKDDVIASVATSPVDDAHAADFAPAWFRTHYSKCTPTEKAATKAIAKGLKLLHRDEPHYGKAEVATDTIKFLSTSSKETLIKMASSKPQWSQEEKTKWITEDRELVQKMLEVLQE